MAKLKTVSLVTKPLQLGSSGKLFTTLYTHTIFNTIHTFCFVLHLFFFIFYLSLSRNFSKQNNNFGGLSKCYRTTCYCTNCLTLQLGQPQAQQQGQQQGGNNLIPTKIGVKIPTFKGEPNENIVAWLLQIQTIFLAQGLVDEPTQATMLLQVLKMLLYIGT